MRLSAKPNGRPWFAGGACFFSWNSLFLYKMIRTVKKLNDVFQTGREMARLVLNYWPDLGPWLAVDFFTYYRHVCLLPYIDDPDDAETVSRPAFTLRREYMPRDCDDKAVLIASWCHGRGVPCRFVASSTRPDGVLHHVFLVYPTIFPYVDLGHHQM